jgi:hypothetical protein
MDLSNIAKRQLGSANRNQNMIEKALAKLGIKLVIKYECVYCETLFDEYEKAIIHSKTCKDD